MGAPPNPRAGMTEHLYNNTFAPRCGAYLGFGTYSRLFTLELCYNTTAPYFFFLLFFFFFFYFILFIYFFIVGKVRLLG